MAHWAYDRGPQTVTLFDQTYVVDNNRHDEDYRYLERGGVCLKHRNKKIGTMSEEMNSQSVI